MSNFVSHRKELFIRAIQEDRGHFMEDNGRFSQATFDRLWDRAEFLINRMYREENEEYVSSPEWDAYLAFRTEQFFWALHFGGEPYPYPDIPKPRTRQQRLAQPAAADAPRAREAAQAEGAPPRQQSQGNRNMQPGPFAERIQRGRLAQPPPAHAVEAQVVARVNREPPRQQSQSNRNVRPTVFAERTQQERVAQLPSAHADRAMIAARMERGPHRQQSHSNRSRQPGALAERTQLGRVVQSPSAHAVGAQVHAGLERAHPGPQDLVLRMRPRQPEPQPIAGPQDEFDDEDRRLMAVASRPREEPGSQDDDDNPRPPRRQRRN